MYQFGVFEGAPYLVSELLVGETLRQQLERGLLPVRKAIDMGVQVAQGMSAAHERGIVHRDVRPENLFVTKDGRVKILDFGLAKLKRPQTGPDASGSTMTHATEPGVVMGTAGYVSPEQVLAGRSTIAPISSPSGPSDTRCSPADVPFSGQPRRIRWPRS